MKLLLWQTFLFYLILYMCTFHLTFKARCATKTVPLLSQRLQYCQKEVWLFTIHSVFLQQVRILEQFKGSCTDNYWEIGRNHHFHLCQKGFWTKLALMQKSSILLRIGHWRLCFHPLAYFLQQRSCEMTRHAMWPQHLWVSLENAAPDKWVCSDERLMEWLAKVMMLWESPFCSHFDLEQHHRLQMVDNLSQRSAWWNQNPSFGSDSVFSIS